jgi:hypothetical protein
MDEVTQQNAALVEEAAAAAQSMQDQAMRLSQAISIFKLTQGAVPVPVAAGAKVAPAYQRKVMPETRNITPRAERLRAEESKSLAVKSDESSWETF